MTSRSFTEGRFLIPPDLRPPSDPKKKDPLRPISRSKSTQVTKPSESLNLESTKRVTFLRPEQSIKRSKLNKAGKSTKKSKKLKKSTKGKNPKLQQQPEQPKPPGQQQHVPKSLPLSPDPFRRETILQLRQNPPSLSAPTANKAHVKHQIVLPRIKTKKVKRRMATIYDVVARRVGRKGFHKNVRASKFRDTASTTKTFITPMEHLFKRPVHWNNKVKGEPYLLADKLPADNPTDQQMKYAKNKFPDNDLLTAMHAYAADKYILGHEPGRKNRNFVSFNESALLAFGILIEELSRSAVGPTGDVSMLRPSVPEAEENRKIDALEWWWRGNKRRKDQKFVRENYRVEYNGTSVRFVRTRKRKPKVQRDDAAKDEGTDATNEDTDGQSVASERSTPNPSRPTPLKRPRSMSRSQSRARSRSRGSSRGSSKKAKYELSSEFVDDSD